MQIVLSIDPGKTGALARFEAGALASITDPANGCLARALSDMLVDDLGDLGAHPVVVIEQVNGMPGQSGPAAFNFGQTYGALLGACTALGVLPVLLRPVDWKARLGLRRVASDTPSTWKAKSVTLARETWPKADWFKRAKDDGRAEAALLGYCAITQGLI